MASTLSSYNIMVTPDASTTIPLLIPGLQLYGSARSNTFSYYQIRLGDDYQDVVIILTIRAGEADLYVSDNYEKRPSFNPTTRTVENYVLRSENTGDDRLEIRHSHFASCTRDCYYVVGVLGKQAVVNEYTIVAKKINSTITLQDGVAVRDFVGPRLFEYFKGGGSSSSSSSVL